MRRCILFVTAAALFTACDSDPLAVPTDSLESATALRVMTRNMYLGADLDPIFAAPADQLPIVAGQVWARIQASDLPRRAGAIADEIIRNSPDVVGLQEVVQYRVQSPGDAVLGGATLATANKFDFLQLLLDSLSARGQTYNVVAANINSDVELPVYTGSGPLPFDDVRFTDRDVMIARAGVQVSNAAHGTYAANVPVPTPAGVITQLRGWTSADVTMGGLTLSLFSTHLEVQGFAPVQAAQLQELLGVIASKTTPVVLMGDLNSAADGTQTPTYGSLISAGFSDTWQHPGNPGFTCCNLPDLSNPQATFDQRLDLVLTRGFTKVNATNTIIGNNVGDRVRSGIWPSDHAGVVVKLEIPAK
jgi:endonuclease/exonuclease/phosphatase family metal-dependent hydrolase